MEDFNNRFLKARKEYIVKSFRSLNLNDMQMQAVLATEGPLLVLAGAGSGKTTVLINRILNLTRFGSASDCDKIPDEADEEWIHALENSLPGAEEYAQYGKAAPWRILAITFTNKAANEIKERLGKSIGEGAEDIWAGTFHSVCVKILRRDADKIGYSNSFTIYDRSDSESMIKRILKDMNIDDKAFAPKSVLNTISHAKDSLIDADRFLRIAEENNDVLNKKVGEIYKEYVHRMFLAEAMDFDDLIYYTVRLLETNDEAREYWQKKFKYILVDEYQDTSKMQFRLVELLADYWKNLCVVGDDDQSIYKFRGATVDNILRFDENYLNCRTIRLEQNYRSTEHILNAANSVISHNIGRKGKNLWTDLGKGDPVELFHANNEEDEANFVASKILTNFSHGGSWRDNAVLYRMNAQSSSLEFAFKRNGIPYKVYGGTKFFDRAEVKDVLAYLSVVFQPEDTVRLTRIINTPARGIGQKSIDTAAEIAARENTSMFDVVCHADRYQELKRASAKMILFSELINSLRSFAELNTPDVLFDELLDKTGYLAACEEKDKAEGTDRAENIRELKSSILTFMKESGDYSLEGYLANVALYTDLDNYDENDGVTMMTMHSAKGLEFDNVFVVGMEETVFPGLKAIGVEDEMEEERRLCYVALTRARKKLYLSCARQRMLFGRTNANRISRFIDEISEEDIHRLNPAPKGYGYSENSFSSYNASSYFNSLYAENEHRMTETKRTDNSKYSVKAAEKPKDTVPVNFAAGERIKHTAFGPGTISSMTPMGGDYLVEIDFDNKGKKKLMLKAASKFMSKL